ncbi:hypothetical protein BP5796_10144 [Coleophoma crateriformis]|uniref:ARM repeat-containing protein n=1 Tax=Coleophoma crateriformis TaxID=565419 RepID=A0A3D8QUM0_9HELO|nr:hypothetical protein BP5796_10144 [Coleophoma crateriformis]
MDTRTGASRNELFQELRPRCIELSELARRDDGTTKTAKELAESTSQLLNLLEQKCRRVDGAFDPKLADYVFFPLSLILRRKETISNRLTELTIKCLNILIVYGWKNAISLDLAKQLLLLLTFVAGGVPGQESKLAPEELIVEAFKALAALFKALSTTPKGPQSLVETSTVPALGHCITVILEGVTDGPSAAVQLQALRALDAIWACVKDLQALSTFLPGTISGLTKCLMPSTKSKRSRKTIVTALQVLQHVLTSILGDIQARVYKDKESSPGNEQQTLTKPWLKATTDQIKLALANVIRLRKHESVEVHQALNKLCLVLLDECHDTLRESAAMLVETAMSLFEEEVSGDLLRRQTSLMDLAVIHTDIAELIKTTVYNWTTSLPRVMQSNDETAKVEALRSLSRAQKLLHDLNLESSILKETLAASLRDSVTATLDPGTTRKKLEEAPFDLNSQALTSLATENAQVIDFKPILMSGESQKQTRQQLQTLLANLGSRSSQIDMANEMLEYMRGAEGPSLLSAYWLSYHLLQAASSANADLDEFLEASVTFSEEEEAANQELFSYSVSLVSESTTTRSDEQDWRLQGIALEVIASTALRMKESFRTELIDTLYPITTLLGSPSPNLRTHAITTLNVLASSCGYQNTSALIVDNVDYMVNAISLRLNTFDISPQAPQVLVMMIRLTGPSLLVYLDDVVASIFAALENFHGYPRLVELLFSVLGEIVDVGSKGEQLKLPSATSTNALQREIPTGPTIGSIVDILKKRKQTQDSNASLDLAHEDFPRSPWKSAKELLDEADLARNPPSDSAEEEQAPTSHSTELAPAPPSKTHTMLTSITRLSQHYLTTASPYLRTKLLVLISKSSLALSNDQDSFLPLLNDIWPVLIPRLHDPETFVIIAAARTLSTLCNSAARARVEREGREGAGQARRLCAEFAGVGAAAKVAGRYCGVHGGECSVVGGGTGIAWPGGH